jgi:carboxypeptidase C (cathepsin A)
MLSFLKDFFEKKSHLIKNDFFLAGESYAGHYLPNIARAILDSNSVQNTKINLKGTP